MIKWICKLSPEFPFKVGSILVIIFFCWLFVRKTTHTSKRETVSTGPQPDMEAITQLMDENGNLISEIRIQELVITKQKAFIDSVRKAIPRKLRPSPGQIKAIDKFQYRVDTVFESTPSVTIRDNKRLYWFEKNDPWLHAVAAAGPDTGFISISLHDTLSRTQVHKKNWFGPDKNYVLITSTSPYSTIRQGYSFVMKDSRPKITLGPSIQYNPITNRFNVGVSIQYPIISIK